MSQIRISLAPYLLTLLFLSCSSVEQDSAVNKDEALDERIIDKPIANAPLYTVDHYQPNNDQNCIHDDSNRAQELCGTKDVPMATILLDRTTFSINKNLAFNYRGDYIPEILEFKKNYDNAVQNIIDANPDEFLSTLHHVTDDLRVKKDNICQKLVEREDYGNGYYRNRAIPEKYAQLLNWVAYRIYLIDSDSDAFFDSVNTNIGCKALEFYRNYYFAEGPTIMETDLPLLYSDTSYYKDSIIELEYLIEYYRLINRIQISDAFAARFNIMAFVALEHTGNARGSGELLRECLITNATNFWSEYWATLGSPSVDQKKASQHSLWNACKEAMELEQSCSFLFAGCEPPAELIASGAERGFYD